MSDEDRALFWKTLLDLEYEGGIGGHLDDARHAFAYRQPRGSIFVDLTNIGIRFEFRPQEDDLDVLEEIHVSVLRRPIVTVRDAMQAEDHSMRWAALTVVARELDRSMADDAAAEEMGLTTPTAQDADILRPYLFPE